MPSGQIEEIAMDMSRAFIAGAGEHFGQARICFDRFLVMKLCGKAVDEVRKQVAREHGGMPKGTLWALRGNRESRSERQRELRDEICKEHAALPRALSLRDFLADLWNCAEENVAREHLEAVLSWCRRSRLKPLVELGRSLKCHTEGILGYFKHYTTSAAIEAINGKLQRAKRRARGYRDSANFRAIAYRIAGGLDISGIPAPTH